jgi:hypothetical protein
MGTRTEPAHAGVGAGLSAIVRFLSAAAPIPVARGRAPDMDCIANTCAKTVFLEQVLRNSLDIMDCNAIHGVYKSVAGHA